MNKTYITIALAILLSLTLVSAIKQEQPITIMQGCVNSTYSNISEIYMDSPRIVLEQGEIAMIPLGSGLYQYNFSHTSNLGKLVVITHCDLNRIDTQATPSFDITSTGYTNNIFLPILLFVIGFGLLVFAVAFKNPFFGLFSGMLITGTGVFIMIYGLGFIADAWTRMVAGVVLGVGLLIMFAAMFEILSPNRDEVNVGFDE